MKYPLILDGATGTMLQAKGMPAGACTEQWVIENPEALQEIQRLYAEAGSNVVYAPTFSATAFKLEQHGLFGMVEEYNSRLVEISKNAVDGKALVAGDISPSGKFLAPMGDITFEELVQLYTQQAQALEQAGVDLYIIETAMSLADARAALLAVKSISKKPVFVTFTVDQRGRTLTGTDVLAAMVTMEAMGADAFGLNCSSGPEDMLTQLSRLRGRTSLPLIAKPNAGLPETADGKTVYNFTPEEFTACVEEMAACGVKIFGGCCGTTPEHIAALSKKVASIEFPASEVKKQLAVATEKNAFFFDSIDAEDCVEFACGSELEDDLMEADETDETFIRIRIYDEDDLENFAEAQWAVNKPLIIRCTKLHLLESALRVYQGVALYLDEGSIDSDELKRLSAAYGVKII